MLHMASDEDQEIAAKRATQLQQKEKKKLNISRRHKGKIMSPNLTFLLPFLLLFVPNSGPTAHAAKILGLFAHPSESNFAVMRTVMTELARRQHNVTVISSHRLNEPVERLEEIIVEPEFQFWRELQLTAGVRNGLHELSQTPDSSLQQSLALVGAAATEHFLSNDRVQAFLARMTTVAFDYDLIIVDLFHTEALLMFGELFNKPTVALLSSNFEHYMTRLLDNVLPVACSPIDFSHSHYVQDAGFWKRLSSVRQCISQRRQFMQGNIAAQQKLIAKYFQHRKERLPSIAELQAKLAVLLVNNHVPLTKPRPSLANIVPVGGLHVRRPRELPWHLRRFLDEARNGAIYVNLGNELMCKEIPKATLSILLSVLGRSQQQVLWTCHDVDRLDGMPANMMLQHMVPQSDILAHPMVKLFVMNGDLLSLQEGLLRHVPMLGIPIFREEHENMDHAVALGVGLKLDYANISEDSLKWALQAVLKDAVFPLRIREVAEIFRNRPMGALETTMYWVDYVLRYRGASHIRTAGLDIPLNHLHLSDLFIYYFAMTLVIVAAFIGLFFVAHILWRRRQTEKIYLKLS